MIKNLLLFFFISSTSIQLIQAEPTSFWSKLKSNDITLLVYEVETDSLHYARWISIEFAEASILAIQKTNCVTEQSLEKISSKNPVILKQEEIQFSSDKSPCPNLLYLWGTNQITQSEYIKRKNRAATPIDLISPYSISFCTTPKMVLTKQEPVNFWHAFPRYQSIDYATNLKEIRDSWLSNLDSPDRYAELENVFFRNLTTNTDELKKDKFIFLSHLFFIL